MSLEQALADLTAAVNENSTLLTKVIGAAATRSAAAGKAASTDDAGDATEEKPKRGRKPAADKETSAPKAVTPKELVMAWLGEIEVEVDDEGEPVDNEDNLKAAKKRDLRKKFVKKCLGKLDAETVADLDSDADKAKFVKWIEAKKAGNDPFEDD